MAIDCESRDLDGEVVITFVSLCSQALNCVSNSTLVTGAKKSSVTIIYHFKSSLFYLGDLES